MRSAIIDGQFAAEKAKFLAKDQEANFNGMQVGKDAFFDEAEFHGPVDFGGADINGQFVAVGAKFLSDKHEANFNGIKLAQDARFDEAEFHGPVILSVPISKDNSWRMGRNS